MKKITLLFFTFSGICCCMAQQTVKTMDTAVDKEKPFVRLFPNPAKNKVEIGIEGFAPGYVKVQLINSAGKLIREEKRLVLTGNEIIIFMFSEIAGLYYLFVKQDRIMLKKKLVIQ